MTVYIVMIKIMFLTQKFNKTKSWSPVGHGALDLEGNHMVGGLI